MIEVYVENFSLNKIANSGQCFRWKELGPAYHSITAGDHYVEALLRNNTLLLSCNEFEYKSYWKRYFSLGENIHLDYDKNDTFLHSAINHGHELRILRQPFFETMISFIISQRKSIPAIKSCIEKLCEKYGEKRTGVGLGFPNETSVEYYTFPQSKVLAQLNADDLRDTGVGYRANYIIEASKRWLDYQEVNDMITDYNKAMTILKSYNGIGDKVANCIALFSLHHLNACPIDVWMQKIIDEEYSGIKPEWMTSKYAGVLQQCAFDYKRNSCTRNC